MLSQAIEGFRLSPQQKQLWLLQQSGGIYCTQCILKITGDLQVEILKLAVQKVVDRHEILRTSFYRQPGIRVPIQVINDSSTFSYQEISQNDPECESIEVFYQQEKRFIFNFEQGPLLRVLLLQESANKWLFLITLPAMCADSWSLKNLVNEISCLYNIGLRGEELKDEPVQYIQFSEWCNELLEDEDSEAGKAYWLRQELNSLPALTLPFESNCSSKSGSCKSAKQTIFEPSIHPLKLEPDLVAKLEAIATLHKTSVADFLLACWQTLLWRITGQSNIIVQTAASGRKYEELQGTLGLLAKNLPICCTFQGDLKFTELLSSISNTLEDHEKWQEYLTEEEHRNADDSFLDLPVSFEFQVWPDSYQSDGVSFSLERQYFCFKRYKLKLHCMLQAEALTAEFHYDPELITPESIPYLAEQFQTLVVCALDNPNVTVGELKIMSDRQLHQLLIEFNQTSSQVASNGLPEKCFQHRFEAQVKQTPNDVAVVFESEQFTYHELNQRANRLAHYLQRLGVGSDVLVGILLEPRHSADAAPTLDIVTVILGILKAGGAYLPLDTALPQESLVLRLQDAQISVLLTQQALMEKLPQDLDPINLGQIVCLDTDSAIIDQESSENPTSEVSSGDLAYVLFTSGSTGKPKGVAIEHRSLLNYVDGILARLDLLPGSRFATFSTFAADLGNTAIFPALCTGGCLHVVSQTQLADPRALANYFQRHPIDCLKIVPSHLAALLTSAEMQSILPRQRLILGGEAANWHLIEQIQRQQPTCRIINHYGPTETTVGVLTYQVDDQSQRHISQTVPLGRPLANTQVYVLDSQLKPLPIGVPGELYIGGAGLARGYLNRPELTEKQFITNPFTNEPRARLYRTGDRVRYLPDGNLEFLGRTDNQVKIRGFRIELGEIEALLDQHPGVQQSVVSVWEEQGNKRLVAYVVPNKQQPPSVSDLRNFLGGKRPDYMVPGSFIFLNILPLKSNGKVDRSSLPVPHQTRPELAATFVAPRNELEQTLADIWQSLLQVEKVGINDNFFELGGHSLLIVQVHSKLQIAFKQDVSITDLFKYPTISALSDYLSQQKGEPSSSLETVQIQAEARLNSRRKRSQTRQRTRTAEKP
ncbi:MAG: amino acid adenylation domain-containing protein [Leptolyngbya sp. SIO1E4]|nr:amino acid adenylation domain-containing protein [Leptolyngbya sp. SIO1E4]